MAEIPLITVLIYCAVFLIAAKLGGLLAAKIKQLPVFGEVIAGIVIGPAVAGWVSMQVFGMRLCIEPTSAAGEFMTTLSDIGIIVLMLLAGLSVEVEEFKRSGKAATIVAIMGVVVAFALGFGTASFFGWSLLEAAFAGAVLVATSVGITVRTLIDVNSLHTKIGMIILGAAVIDDVLGIIILSVLSGVAYGGLSFYGLAGTLAFMAIFFFVLIVVGFKLIPRLVEFFDRFLVEEIVLSIVLALVFLIAALAEQLRIAAITGAFLVGMILSKTTTASELRHKIAIIGYGFLIPLFFVEMGIRTDLQSLAQVSFLAFVFLGIAMFDKIAGCVLGGLLSRLNLKDSLKVGIGMMPRGEVGLVIAAIGVKVGVVGPHLLSMTVMIVLMTSLITPTLVKIAFKDNAENGDRDVRPSDR